MQSGPKFSVKGQWNVAFPVNKIQKLVKDQNALSSVIPYFLLLGIDSKYMGGVYFFAIAEPAAIHAVMSHSIHSDIQVQIGQSVRSPFWGIVGIAGRVKPYILAFRPA